jgi:hypothetical protein
MAHYLYCRWQDEITTGTATTVNTNDTFKLWLHNSTYTSTAYVWHKWAITSSTATDYITIDDYTDVDPIIRVEPYDRAPAIVHDRSYWEQRIAQESERQRARFAHEKEVQERARELLMSLLSPEQARDLIERGHFFVHGRDARYRIRQGRSANVDVIDRSGIVKHRLCVHPAALVPDFDQMAAQLLHIITDEEGFVNKANRHPNIGTPVQIAPVLQ